MATANETLTKYMYGTIIVSSTIILGRQQPKKSQIASKLDVKVLTRSGIKTLGNSKKK